MTTKEFRQWCKIQEAIRVWCKKNPDKEPPGWMSSKLEQAEAAHRKAKVKAK